MQIDVSDTGIGMDEDTRRRCLEPFFTTKGERGTGLGLWVTRGILEEQGGRLQLRSSTTGRHRGTTVRVQLPVLQQSPISSEPAALVN